LGTFIETKNLRKYFSFQWFFEPGNWQKPYNCTSIVIIHIKKIQLLRRFFDPGKLQKSRNLEIFSDATNEIEN